MPSASQIPPERKKEAALGPGREGVGEFGVETHAAVGHAAGVEEGGIQFDMLAQVRQ